jgi:5-methylthioadenosine/S-adenosylhomocysteine deaminase
MKLGSGAAPVAAMLAAGITVGLGTDGAASNNDLDLFGEMGSLARLHKGANLDPTLLPAGRALAMATTGGAAALGLAGKIGELRPGMLADCIVIDLDQPHLTPFYRPDLLVYAGRGGDVTASVINGRLVMANRRLLTLDPHETMAKVRELARSAGNG